MDDVKAEERTPAQTAEEVGTGGPTAGGVRRVIRRERLLVAAGVVAAVTLGVVFRPFSDGGDAERPEPGTRQEEQPADPARAGSATASAPQATPKELLALGRTALAEGRVQEAQAHLADGLLAVEPRQRKLKADLCRAMADVSHRRGEPGAARLYREEAARLVSGLDGASLALFDMADQDLEAGRVREARRRLHAIILGAGGRAPVGEELIREAERRLALAFEAEFEAGLSGRHPAEAPEIVLFPEEGR